MKKNEYELGSASGRPQRRGPGGPGGPMGAGEKAKDFKGIMKQLIQYAKGASAFMVLAVIFAMGGSILTLMGPDNLSRLTDEITAGIMTSIDMDAIYKIGIFLVCVYALSYVLSILQGVIMATVMQGVAKRLRSDIGGKINRLPMKYFSTHSKGDVLSRVTNDVDTIGQTLTQSVGTLISAITLLVGSVIMMAITNVTLTITAILSTIFGFVFMMTVMKLSQKYFKRQQKHLGEINGHIEEMYAGHTVVKVYNGEEEATKVFHSINQELKESAFRAQAMSGLMMPVMTFIGNLGYVCVCIVGALLAMNNVISFGVIVAFMVYIRLFTQPLGQVAQGMQNLQSGAAAAERVFEFLEEEEMSDESHKSATLTNVEGNIEFQNVHFGYDSDKIIINDFSASVKAGEKIAIVGPTGAGKTTMVNLLMRFYEMQSGNILIDNISIRDVKREEVHSQFCMVLQDTWLFEGTLRDNLIYCSENTSDQQLEEACKAVGLHHFIRTLPHGYHTVLNDALNLSAGQKQQLTIARAMIADKPIIILDEATSSIDTRTELKIQEAMDQLMENRTSFVIAHRLSTIKNADLILVMKDGDVIEKGTHLELLEQKGFYAELYNSQFEKVG
ncbi:MAG: ABC transporter ATP-binding protein [Eubacteriales bacterium]